MDPIVFACILGIALITVECLLRLAISGRRARALALVESALNEEILRLEDDIAEMLFAASERENRTTMQLSSVAPEDRSALESRLTVGCLLEAERDERRARKELERLRAHRWSLKSMR